jgi:hypothetical protein
MVAAIKLELVAAFVGIRTQAQRAEILSMLAAGRSAAEVARLFQVHRATISRLGAASRQATAPLGRVVHFTFEYLAENEPTR